MNLELKDPLYEGKSKALYEIGTSNDKLIMRFKDDVTAFNNEKRDVIKGKGFFNNQICSRIFEYLYSEGVLNHFVMRLSDVDMIVQKTDVIPIEVVIRNYITGGLAKRFGIENRKGEKLTLPCSDRDGSILELFYKSDELGDPLINKSQAITLGYATDSQIMNMERIANNVNFHLKPYFDKLGIILADFKLEFGTNKNGSVFLVDDICPDGCRLWDKSTGEVFDKDNYRFNYGDVYSAYREVYKRIISVYEEGMSIENYLLIQSKKEQ